MKFSRFFTLLAGVGLTAQVFMAQSLPKIDLTKIGPQVGEPAPNFSLKDQNGKTWRLDSIMGPKGAMLVFYRSAAW